MAEEARKREVPLALELGYKLNLHATYFEAIRDQSIDTDRLSGTLRYIRQELTIVNEYHSFLFGATLDLPENLATQEAIREYLGSTLRLVEAKIHVRYGGPIEAAFELGCMFALSDLASPSESMEDSFLNMLGDLIQRAGLKMDDDLKRVLSDLLSEDLEQRVRARQEVFKRIEELYGERVGSSWLTSWLSGLELTVGLPALLEVKKTWK